MDPKRTAVRRAMQKQAKVKNVYEAITMEMLTISTGACFGSLPITPNRYKLPRRPHHG